MKKIKLDKIEEAIESIKRGEIIIVVDDENRENEGDFITAAETIDPSKNKFYGKIWKRSNLCTNVRKSMF